MICSDTVLYFEVLGEHMRIKWTLVKKIQLLVLIILLVIMGLSQFIISRYVTLDTRRVFQENVAYTSNLLQKNIEVFFQEAALSLRYIEERYEGQVPEEAYIREYLSLQQETKDYIINSYIAFDDGSFYSEPSSDVPVGFDPRVRPWYGTVYGTNEVGWTEPYADIVTGELVVTGSVFVQMDGTTGVAGMDIRFERLVDVLASGRMADSSVVLLVDNEGNIIADRDGLMTGGNITDFEDEFLDESGLITGSIETKHGLYLFRRLNQTELRLVAFMPHEVLNAAGRQIRFTMTWVMISMLLIGVVMATIVAKQVTGPITKLTNTIHESKGRNDLLLYEGKGEDEIKTLIDSYNSLAMDINIHQKDLLKLSDELMISERKLQAQYDHASKLAYRDYLTGMPNRIRFEKEAREMIEGGVQFAMLFFDLDNFKYINDTYGHHYGDEVLSVLAERISGLALEQGHMIAARLGGDEFGILFPDYKTPEGFMSFGSSLQKAIRMPIFIEELEFFITASIGISLFPEDAATYEMLMTNADIAMYEAKKRTKDSVNRYKASQKEALLDRVNIETRLLKSLEFNEMYVCYQPLIDCRTSEVEGFEALIRWSAEGLGLIFPDVFIPIAEHNHYINDIGEFVLMESLGFQQRLYERFGKRYEMNINVSAIQLHQVNFVEDVRRVVEEFGGHYEAVNLEVTESIALEEDLMIHDKLTALRKLGMSISLDDFGTGYSSFNHLLKLSLTHMKIDRSIIEEATSKEEVHQLIKGLVAFAHKIDLKVVAEGIEDERMESLIKQMGADYAQGYYYLKPLTEHDIVRYLENRHH